MAILEIKNVVFRYEEEKDMIINHVSFSLEKGEFISIVGKNGCGKSTLAKLIVNLIKPQEGEIIFNKENKDNKIGYVFQNPDNQFVGNTVADDIAFGLENKRIAQKDMDSIIDDVLNHRLTTRDVINRYLNGDNYSYEDGLREFRSKLK